MANRRLLIAYAHPDDESFGLGALIGKYVAEGVEVYLICATNGDVGTIAPEHMNGFNSVTEVRLAELECAAKVLGLKEVFKFGYRDSGMMKSAFNEDPACLWYNWHNHPDDVTRRVVEVIRDVQPQVIITFNKYGGYGHPDHIAIQAATTRAFTLAGDPTYNTGQPACQPQKLYYSSIPALLIRMGILMMRLRGQDPRRMGTNQDIDIQAILDYIEPAHTRVHISRYYGIWDEAGACHKSQGGGRGGWFPRSLRRYFSPYQTFTRVYPEPTHARIDENDMFEGVRIE